jgi:putative endonuclease
MAYTNNLQTHNGLIGKLGEDYACEYLISKNYKIIERNFKIRMGEIDIIALKNNKLHIIEVKTSQSKQVRPEENMHAVKMRKVAKLGEVYSRGKLFCIDFIGVSLNSNNTLLKITHLENLEIY